MKYVLILTIDNSIFDKWTKTVWESVPVIPTVQNVEKKQYFLITISLIDYSLDKKKNAHVVYNLKILRPDNSIYFEKDNLIAVKSQISNPHIILGDSTLKVCFEPEDQYGTYTVSVIIKDKIDDSIEKIEKKINLIKFENREYFHEDQKFFNWVYNYHIEPLPEKAIDAFFYSIKNQIIEKKNSLEPYLCFFIEIFNENKYLIPHLIELFDSLDEKSKYYILLLFTNIDYDFNNFFSSLKNEDQDLYKFVLHKYEGLDNYFNPYSDDLNIHTMDMLWGTFFGSGKFKPIYRIAEMLQLKEYYEYYEKLKNGEKVTEEERQKGFLGMIFIQANKSLQSNCRNHKLVLNYCTHIFENEIKSKSMKLEIMDVLMSFSHVEMDYNM